MRHHVTRLTAPPSAVAALALLALACPCATHAQSGQTRRDEWRAEMEARQRALRRWGDAARRPASKRPDGRPSYQEVAEDFKQLQLRSYELSLAAKAAAPHDYRQIREHAAEIKKRASRLRQTLALPDAGDAAKEKRAEAAFTPEWVAAAVATLEAAVKSFAWNPTFQRPDVVVLEDSLRARRDLEEILRLSERITKCAEALGKGGRAAKDD